MKTMYKIVSSSGLENLFKKEWFATTKKLAEAFKTEKEKSEPCTDSPGYVSQGNKYHIIPVEVMEKEDDFYKKELR